MTAYISFFSNYTQGTAAADTVKGFRLRDSSIPIPDVSETVWTNLTNFDEGEEVIRGTSGNFLIKYKANGFVPFGDRSDPLQSNDFHVRPWQDSYAFDWLEMASYAGSNYTCVVTAGSTGGWPPPLDPNNKWQQTDTPYWTTVGAPRRFALMDDNYNNTSKEVSGGDLTVDFENTYLGTNQLYDLIGLFGIEGADSLDLEYYPDNTYTTPTYTASQSLIDTSDFPFPATTPLSSHDINIDEWSYRNQPGIRENFASKFIMKAPTSERTRYGRIVLNQLPMGLGTDVKVSLAALRFSPAMELGVFRSIRTVSIDDYSETNDSSGSNKLIISPFYRERHVITIEMSEGTDLGNPNTSAWIDFLKGMRGKEVMFMGKEGFEYRDSHLVGVLENSTMTLGDGNKRELSLEILSLI